MSPVRSFVELSRLDEKRFGLRVARAPCVTADSLPGIMSFCHEHRVSLLISRCEASEIVVAQSMEEAGFRLMDTLVYYSVSLADAPFRSVDVPDSCIRPVRPGEENTVRDVASRAFANYLGHYHADRRLDTSKCDDIYADWAFRSCFDRSETSEVLVCELDESIAGFATVRLNRDKEGEGVLSGVAPAARKRGIHLAMLLARMDWCRNKGAGHMLISSQLANAVVQRNWVRVGFVPHHALYTFHKWFSEE